MPLYFLALLSKEAYLEKKCVSDSFLGQKFPAIFPASKSIMSRILDM
jgi:hypothetical protein